jgi:hypothetical protein
MASLDELVAVALRHAAAEGEGDIETTMATLEADPVYELQPMRRRLVGRDNARRYYEYFFSTFLPTVENYELRAEWINDNGVAQEYSMWVRDGDGSVARHEIIGILTFGPTLLSGERLYGTEELFRLMFGPLYDEAEPVPP